MNQIKTTSSQLGILCNGLTLITMSMSIYSLYLWNPSTRKLKTIPLPTYTQALNWDHHTFVYGVGYDDSTDDYKVVCKLSCCIEDYSRTHRTKIYSVGTDSWKEIVNFGKGTVSSKGKFVNGKLHWLAAKGGVQTIVSLDLVEGKERSQVVALPEYFSNHRDSFGRKLEILGGYLSLIDVNDSMLDINVWVMMKYDVAESWTRIWRLSDFNDGRQGTLLFGGATPFWVTENGDVFVIFDNSKIVVYNGKSRLREYRIHIDVALQEYSLGEEPLLHVESLVSP